MDTKLNVKRGLYIICTLLLVGLCSFFLMRVTIGLESGDFVRVSDTVLGLTGILAAGAFTGFFTVCPVRIDFEWALCMTIAGASSFFGGSPYQRLNKAFSAEWFLIAEPIVFSGILVLGIQGAARAVREGLLKKSVIGRRIGRIIQREQEKFRIELITNMSHDLRTPLTSIVGYVEQLEDMRLEDEARECVLKLDRKCDYLQSVIEDVFELSKAAVGQAVMKNERIDLAFTVRQTLDEFSEEFEQAGLFLDADFCAEKTEVYCDGAHIHRVFANLCENIVRYADASMPVSVRVGDSGQKTVTVRFENVSRKKMDFTGEEIVERFRRGSGAERRAGDCAGSGAESRTGDCAGSGLGLAVAKSFTEACGGAFCVEVSGDRFAAAVTFPLAKKMRTQKLKPPRDFERIPKESRKLFARIFPLKRDIFKTP